MSERHSIIKNAAILGLVAAPLAICGLTANWASESLKDLKNCQKPVLGDSESIDQESGSRHIIQLNEQSADGSITRVCNSNIDNANGEKQTDVDYSNGDIRIQIMSQEGPVNTEIIMIRTPNMIITSSNKSPLNIQVRP